MPMMLDLLPTLGVRSLRSNSDGSDAIGMKHDISRTRTKYVNGEA
jgi:hypothetical protein